MIKKAALVLLLLSAFAAQARDAAPASAAQNYRATRDYYSRLVNAPAPNIAELQLMMNLLPKGGDLHHHYSGAIYAEDYLAAAGRAGYCIYREDDAERAAKKFQLETRLAAGALLPKNCLPVEAVYRDGDFYRALLRRWSDKDFDASWPKEAGDQHFFNTFGYFGPVTDAEINAHLQTLKQRAKAENLQYIESMFKGGPVAPNETLAAAINRLPENAGDAEVAAALQPYLDFMLADAGARAGLADYLQRIDSEAAGIDDDGFTLRFQSYVFRGAPPAQVFSSMVSAFLAAGQNKRLVGVNIVGAENERIALRDYRLHMRMFAFLHQRYPAVQLALHAGELTLGMVPPEQLRSHIHDAVMTGGALRIGHGTDLVYEDAPDALLRLLREKDIPVEINLTSGVFILGVKDEAHPVSLYLKYGVPIVLSSDDVGVSRNNLTGEYVLFASRYKPSYERLKKVVANGIRYSFLTPAEKQQQLRELDRRFREFEARIAALRKSGVAP